MCAEILQSKTGGNKLVFACSGAADVGGISDQAARKLAAETPLSLCCTAAVAAEIPAILQRAKEADAILAIDGCNQKCARKILEQAGLSVSTHIELGNLGMDKGKSPCTFVRVAMTAQCARDACGI